MIDEIQDLGTDPLIYERSAPHRNRFFEIAPRGKDGHPDWSREFATTVGDCEESAKLICFAVNAVRNAARITGLTPLEVAEGIEDGEWLARKALEDQWSNR